LVLPVTLWEIVSLFDLSRLGWVLSVGALISLAACEHMDFARLTSGKADPPPEPAKAEARVAAPANAVALPLAPPKPEAPTSPPQVPQTARLIPAQLVGLEEEQARLLLGPASAVRDVPPATVWEYRINGCALDLFFYMDVADKRYRSLAYDLRSTTGSAQGDAAAQRCLNLIGSERHGS
jgi:hypothetical protein